MYNDNIGQRVNVLYIIGNNNGNIWIYIEVIYWLLQMYKISSPRVAFTLLSKSMDKYGQCRHDNVLHPPGSLHHGTKVVIVVDGRADSRVVIQKFIPSYLKNSKCFDYQTMEIWN